MIRRALKKNFCFFYSFLNNCINFKHSKMKMYNHLWIKVSMSFNVCPVNIKCSPVAKITGISSWSINLHPHLEASRKLKEALCLLLFPSFVPVFVEKWIWLEDSKMNLQSLPSYLCQADDAESRLLTVICLCRKPLGFPLLGAHAFTIKCPCPSCFQENTRKAE